MVLKCFFWEKKDILQIKEESNVRFFPTKPGTLNGLEMRMKPKGGSKKNHDWNGKIQALGLVPPRKNGRTGHTKSSSGGLK